jgi:mono/diheme cytochrome c family protein
MDQEIGVFSARAFGKGAVATVRGARALAIVLGLGACVPGVREYIDPPPVGVGGVGFGGGPSGPQPVFGRGRSADPAPPPISGGTLAALADGRTAVAADPDRDRVFVADYASEQLVAEIALQPGDEPGRVVEDSDGRVHVVLRRAGALLTLERDPWRVTSRRPVCVAPRGLAHDRRQQSLHVVCAEGELVSLAPAADGPVLRRVALDDDLRDVVVDGDVLLISRFRSAEVLTVNASGQVLARQTPPDRQTHIFNRGQLERGGPPLPARMLSTVAWRLVGLRPGQAVLLHQRALDGEVEAQRGGYGNGCGGIVESVASAVGPLAPLTAPAALPGDVILAVDLAVSPDGRMLAAVSPANARTGGAQLFQQRIDSLSQPGQDCGRGAGGRGGSQGGAGGAGGSAGGPGRTPDAGTDVELPDPIEAQQPTGEATAVAFTPRGHLLVQTREPASLQLVTGNRTVLLSRVSREDTGHSIFHANSSAGMACAACHPEGTQDGRVWRFRDARGTLEVRRTQNLGGGISATAPFHWNGDLKDLGALMATVFVERMNGPALDSEQLGALGRWMDTIPAPPSLPARDPEAVERGRALFQSSPAACSTCHAGALLTDNKTVDVGTGHALQVPSLRGLRWRAPYMHDGCAATLADRFTPTCGGGDRHGFTSALSAEQIADLVAYLETL